MSRKKSKKLALAKEPQATAIETQLLDSIKEVPSKKEQMANMLFNSFLKKTMKIFTFTENEYLSITPYADRDEADKDDGSDIVCYEITPKSNENVVVYVDDKDLYVSLKGTGVDLNEDETAFLVANILGYVRKYCEIAA